MRGNLIERTTCANKQIVHVGDLVSYVSQQTQKTRFCYVTELEHRTHSKTFIWGKWADSAEEARLLHFEGHRPFFSTTHVGNDHPTIKVIKSKALRYTG